MKKQKLVFSLISFLLAASIFVGGVFAWFAADNQQNNQYYIFSGTADVKAEAFLGLDDDFDGVLNETVGDVSTRAEVLANRYVTLNQAIRDHLNPNDDLQDGYFTDIYTGRMLTYKIVLLNNGERDVSIDVSFGVMQDAFYEALDYYLNDTTHSVVSDALKTFYSQNSARLLFSVSGVKTTIYSKDGGDAANSLTEGYSTASVPVVDSTERALWQYGAGQSFVGQNINDSTAEIDQNLIVTLPADKLIEIDFLLNCTQNSASISQYLTTAQSLYYQTYVERYPTGLTTFGETAIRNAITAIVGAEQSFIYSSDQEEGGIFTGKMEYEIPFIKIRATILPNN